MSDYPGNRKIPKAPSYDPHPGLVGSIGSFIGDAVRGIGQPSRPADANPGLSSNVSDLPAAGMEALKARKSKRSNPVSYADNLTK